MRSLLLVLLLLAWPARAEIYAGVSAEGVPVFSDRPADGLSLYPGSADLPADKPGRAQTREAFHAGMRRYAPQISATAAEHGLEPALLHAVIQVESGYDMAAISPKGAIGLMQLMPATARRMGVADARNPVANLSGGARYLRELLQAFRGDLALALAAYNAGEAAVRRHAMRIPPFPETISYVRAVLRRYELLKGRP